MSTMDLSCRDFTEALASASPTPGGGGAAALAGALGTALGAMVGNLTTGKKKYAPVQEDIERMLSEARRLQAVLLDLVDKDAEAFRPLAEAYRLPSGTEEEQVHKEAVMEEALTAACRPPLAIMHGVVEALSLQEEMCEKGSVMALSDVGAGAALLQGALKAASLNIYINAGSMKNRERAQALLFETEDLLCGGESLAQKIFDEVRSRLLHE